MGLAAGMQWGIFALDHRRWRLRPAGRPGLALQHPYAFFQPAQLLIVRHLAALGRRAIRRARLRAAETRARAKPTRSRTGQPLIVLQRAVGEVGESLALAALLLCPHQEFRRQWGLFVV